MTDSVDTYFEAWNETDGVARRALVERCLTEDVELIDETGASADTTALALLWPASMNKSLAAESSSRAASTSSVESLATHGTFLAKTATR